MCIDKSSHRNSRVAAKRGRSGSEAREFLKKIAANARQWRIGEERGWERGEKRDDIRAKRSAIYGHPSTSRVIATARDLARYPDRRGCSCTYHDYAKFWSLVTPSRAPLPLVPILLPRPSAYFDNGGEIHRRRSPGSIRKHSFSPSPFLILSLSSPVSCP